MSTGSVRRASARQRARPPSAGPARPSARSKPRRSIGTTLSPLLFPRQFPLLAQSYLEEDQEDHCAETERDQRDGEHFAGQAADQGGADRTSDNERRGRSERHDARAGRHRPKVSLRLAGAERPTRQLGRQRDQEAPIVAFAARVPDRYLTTSVPAPSRPRPPSGAAGSPTAGPAPRPGRALWAPASRETAKRRDFLGQPGLGVHRLVPSARPRTG